MSRAPSPLARRLWDVVVAAHRVEPRWDVPELRVTLGGPRVEYAMLDALRMAHRAAGVPPWKPALRQGWPHVTATLTDTDELALRGRPPAKREESEAA